MVVEPARRRGERPGEPRAMYPVRYDLPVALILAGLASGLAVLLLSVLYRWGVSGGEDRDREQAARDYFSEHGERSP